MILLMKPMIQRIILLVFFLVQVNMLKLRRNFEKRMVRNDGNFRFCYR